MEFVSGYRMAVQIDQEYTALRWSGATYRGQWVRSANPGLHLHHLLLRRRPGHSMSYDDFLTEVGQQLEWTGVNADYLITAVSDLTDEEIRAGLEPFAAWMLHKDGVAPLPLIVQPDSVGISQLANHWPVEVFAKSRVAVVGAGSIGGATAVALAGYGVGRVELVDFDRLYFHNTVRHVLGPEHVGRTKVSALRDHIERRWPTTKVGVSEVDVVESTHLIHDLVADADVVVCAADGIAPRRVVSHLGKRHGTTSILACVLDDGAYGEVIRIRPGSRFGCLMCQRAALISSGGIDAEAAQETPYAENTGQHHRPMTAVGPDLHLVGQMAAKMAISTVLQSQGEQSHALPGEQVIMALRPVPGNAAPFDLRFANDAEWHPAVTPRQECFTCSKI